MRVCGTALTACTSRVAAAMRSMAVVVVVVVLVVVVLSVVVFGEAGGVGETGAVSVGAVREARPHAHVRLCFAAEKGCCIRGKRRGLQLVDLAEPCLAAQRR